MFNGRIQKNAIKNKNENVMPNPTSHLAFECVILRNLQKFVNCVLIKCLKKVLSVFSFDFG